MVRVSSIQKSAMSDVYTPPKLPPYLANAFNMKPVVGIPTDDEVKLIHAVIRAAENASHSERFH